MNRLRLRPSTFVLLCTIAMSVAACATSDAMHAAESGDRARLRSDVKEEEAAGTMTNREAAKLGYAVAARELGDAKGDDAVQRIEDVEACAIDLDTVLADRAKTHDEAGARAELLRLEDGRITEAKARSMRSERGGGHESQAATEPIDGWRAFETRGLIRKEDVDARQRAMRDASPEVRRAAMRSSARAQDERDDAMLADAARTDPDPFVRGLAVRALGSLPPQTRPGIARVDRLRDLWTGGDEPLREDVAVAYTMPGVYKYGGEQALAVVLAEGNGQGAIAAAGAVLRSPRMSDASVAAARALVLRSLTSGSLRDRLHALAVAPSRGTDGQKDIDDAIVKMATDDDQRVRVAALSRLSAEHAKGVPDPGAALRKLSTSSDAAIATRARAALARAGDKTVQASLEHDLAAEGWLTRLAAADGLADLGMAGRAAPLLADDSAEVRTRAACTLILARNK